MTANPADAGRELDCRWTNSIHVRLLRPFAYAAHQRADREFGDGLEVASGARKRDNESRARP